MSHIPNNAMPHAKAENSRQDGSYSGWMSQSMGRITDTVREHPVAVAAGAAAVVAAAAAIPVARSRGWIGSASPGGENQ